MLEPSDSIFLLTYRDAESWPKILEDLIIVDAFLKSFNRFQQSSTSQSFLCGVIESSTLPMVDDECLLCLPSGNVYNFDKNDKDKFRQIGQMNIAEYSICLVLNDDHNNDNIIHRQNADFVGHCHVIQFSENLHNILKSIHIRIEQNQNGLSLYCDPYHYKYDDYETCYNINGVNWSLRMKNSPSIDQENPSDSIVEFIENLRDVNITKNPSPIIDMDPVCDHHLLICVDHPSYEDWSKLDDPLVLNCVSDLLNEIGHLYIDSVWLTDPRRSSSLIAEKTIDSKSSSRHSQDSQDLPTTSTTAIGSRQLDNIFGEKPSHPSRVLCSLIERSANPINLHHRDIIVLPEGRIFRSKSSHESHSDWRLRCRQVGEYLRKLEKGGAVFSNISECVQKGIYVFLDDSSNDAYYRLNKDFPTVNTFRVSHIRHGSGGSLRNVVIVGVMSGDRWYFDWYANIEYNELIQNVILPAFKPNRQIFIKKWIGRTGLKQNELFDLKASHAMSHFFDTFDESPVQQKPKLLTPVPRRIINIPYRHPMAPGHPVYIQNPNIVHRMDQPIRHPVAPSSLFPAIMYPQ